VVALDGCRTVAETETVTRFHVTLRVLPVRSCRPLNARDALTARRVVQAPCARAAACQLATPYVDAGLVVEWNARRLARRWRGSFVPDDGDDGSAGVREPRRPRPSAGSAAPAVEPPAGWSSAPAAAIKLGGSGWERR
jgi:hypothetical protein